MSYGTKTVNDKESLYLLQCLDANCNDCRWMTRDLEKYKVAQETRKQIMIDHFNAVNQKEAETAMERCRAGKIDAIDLARILNEIRSRQYAHRTPNPQINYGHCTHPTEGPKAVNFLPTTFMEETQHCFEHRKGESSDQR